MDNTPTTSFLPAILISQQLSNNFRPQAQPHHKRIYRTAEERLPKKRAKLTDDVSICSVASFPCCSKNCLTNLGADCIHSCRLHYAAQNESERMSYILTYMQAAATKPWPHTVFSFRLQGLEVCIKAFQMVYGFSKKKWTAAKEYYITSTSIPIHGNKDLVRPSAEQQHSRLWLSLFVESIGDRHPTNGSIHLPISLTKKDIHSLMIEQEADISHLSYSAFCEMWKTYFSHVKQPQGCHLGKCLECISLASSRL